MTKSNSIYANRYPTNNDPSSMVETFNPNFTHESNFPRIKAKNTSDELVGFNFNPNKNVISSESQFTGTEKSGDHFYKTSN